MTRAHIANGLVDHLLKIEETNEILLEHHLDMVVFDLE